MVWRTTKRNEKGWDEGKEKERENEKNKKGQQEQSLWALLVCTNIQTHQITDSWYGYGYG